MVNINSHANHYAHQLINTPVKQLNEHFQQIEIIHIHKVS